MKYLYSILGVILLMLSVFEIRACKNDKPTPPIITTTSVSAIIYTTATSGGNITSDGGADITARGVCWSTTENPTIELSTKTTDGTGTGVFTSSITGLTVSTTYYVRAYATNIAGTSYGAQISFFTVQDGQIADIDGNIYNTVTIGTQVWMKENLKTTKYKTNLAIDYPGTDNKAWSTNNTGAYAWYNNDVANKAIYGGLYNWYAVNTGNLCPTGWHVPTDYEWTSLTTYLGGVSIAGGKMKEIGTKHWIKPNTCADNSSGFTALPDVSREYDGVFQGVGYFGRWWSSNEYDAANAWLTYLFSNSCNAYRHDYNKYTGFSVRCIKDN
jgi:uncharacterized protein (TIGR02145 family)